MKYSRFSPYLPCQHFSCLQRLLEVPVDRLCSLIQGCPLLGVNESISHVQEWRSQADAYTPGFCLEVREDVSLPFVSSVLRETPSPFCQDNRSCTIPIYTHTARQLQARYWRGKLGMVVSTCEAKDLSQGTSDRLNEWLSIPSIPTHAERLTFICFKHWDSWKFCLWCRFCPNQFTSMFHDLCFSLTQNISCRQSA